MDEKNIHGFITLVYKASATLDIIREKLKKKIFGTEKTDVAVQLLFVLILAISQNIKWKIRLMALGKNITLTP